MIRDRNVEQQAASSLECGLLIVSILVIGGAWAAFMPGGQLADRPQTEVASIAESGDAGKQVLFALIYMLNLGLLVRSTHLRSWQFIGLPLFALLTWCFLSATWSVLPDGTVRRAAAMAGTIVVGLYAGQRFDEKQFSAVLCGAAGIAVIGSLLWGTAAPAQGFDTEGNLRGLFYHKNAFGLFLALSIVATFYRIVVLRQRSSRYFILLGLCILTFILTRSATPIVGMTAALLAFGVAKLAAGSNGPIQIMLPAIIAVIVAVAMLFGGDLYGPVAELLDRNATMSGRTEIWAFVAPMVGDHPWLGYGYGIFWLGEDAPGGLFWHWTKQYELHAHDGYLQLLLDTGVVGLSLFLAALGLLIIRTIRLNSLGKSSLSLWITLFLGYFLVCNITDTELWQSNSIMTTLFIWAVVRINKETSLHEGARLYSVGKRSPAWQGV